MSYPGKAQGIRMQGVRGNAPVNPVVKPKGPPNTVTHVAPVEWVAVQYFDGNGDQQHTMAVRIGGQFYLPPQAETMAWVDSFRAPKDWMNTALTNLVPSSEKARVAIPVCDVDFDAPPVAVANVIDEGK